MSGIFPAIRLHLPAIALLPDIVSASLLRLLSQTLSARIHRACLREVKCVCSEYCIAEGAVKELHEMHGEHRKTRARGGVGEYCSDGEYGEKGRP